MKTIKKSVAAIFLSCLAIVSLRADVVFIEQFNYADGAITNVAAGVWSKHSGNATGSDALVANHNLQVGMSRQDDINRPFNNGFTNSVTNLFVSFTVNCTNLPTAANYFAHFLVNATTFHGRLWNAPGNLPGTWKLGITTASTTLGLIRFFPTDLATNTDYQVIMQWDATQGINAVAGLWVNPLSSGSPSAIAGETVSPAPAAATAFGFRQPGSFNGANNFNITNLVAATTFEEAATNVWRTNAVAPVMVYSPRSGTNFLNTPFPVLLTGVAAGQDLGNLTYSWLKNGAIYPNPNGNTNTLVTSSASELDSGAYQLVATTPYGLSATSAVANLVVTNALIPPIIITHPASTTVYFGQTARLAADAFGPGNITYQWNHFGTNLPGEVGKTLTLLNVQTNNGTTGGYTCGITNEYGGVLTSNAVVSAIPIPQVSIAFLRTLVDANFIATNTSLSGPLFQATGTVTTFTNLTTGNTSSYYIQDGTAGINIFATLAQAFRPALGDIVTFVGILSSFNSTLELLVDPVNTPASTNYIVSSGNPLPAPRVIPFGITNNLAQAEALEGTFVMLTNVFFGTNAGTAILTNANTTAVVSNGRGEAFNLFFSSQDQDTAGQTLPSFAWTVRGVLAQNLNNTTTPRNQLYNVTVTKFSDIVTNAPPAMSAAVSTSGNNPTLTWSADPYNYSYSVLAPEPSYVAALNGANEVPASGSTATGSGRVVVSPDGSRITVNMNFSGLSAPATAAHIHGPAGIGVNTNVLFGFTGVPAATSGAIPEQSFTLSPTQAFYLHNGLLYMNVHNTNFGGGEIRDQLRLAPPSATGTYRVQTNFQATMLGINEVPANGSTGTGFGTVVLSPDQTTITVNMSFSGLTAPATAAHIHGPAGIGVNTNVLFGFTGVPAATSGSIPEQSFPITSAQVSNLQSGLFYMNVHNATYQNGELRGQLLLGPSSVGKTFTTTNASYTDVGKSSQKFYRVSSP